MNSAKGLLMILLGVIGGPMVTWSGCSTNSRIATLQEKGVAVEGVVNGGTSTRRRKSSSYKINVTYPTREKGPITQDFDVTSSFFNANSDETSMKIDTVPIRYRESSPTDAIVVGATPDGTIWIWGGLIGGLIIAAGGVFTMKE